MPTANTLNWIEHLPEIGTPILQQRDRLLELLAQIDGLQKIARRREAELNKEIAEHWLPAEIALAQDRCRKKDAESIESDLASIE